MGKKKRATPPRAISPARMRGNASGYINHLVEKALALKSQSDFSEDAYGKDGRAYDALCIAAELNEALVGWAMDHAIGLAIEGHSFMPRQPSGGIGRRGTHAYSGTKNNLDYIEYRRMADDHQHELVGSQPRSHTLLADPEVARKFLLSLLRANPAWPHEVTIYLTNLVEQEVFQQENPGAKIDFYEARQQLRALCYVEYYHQLGINRDAAITKVAEAYGVSKNTMESWKKRLPRYMSQLEMSRQITMAKNKGSSGNNTDDAKLCEAGQEYRAHKKKRKHKPKIKMKRGRNYPA